MSLELPFAQPVRISLVERVSDVGLMATAHLEFGDQSLGGLRILRCPSAVVTVRGSHTRQITAVHLFDLYRHQRKVGGALLCASVAPMSMAARFLVWCRRGGGVFVLGSGWLFGVAC